MLLCRKYRFLHRDGRGGNLSRPATICLIYSYYCNAAGIASPFFAQLRLVEAARFCSESGVSAMRRCSRPATGAAFLRVVSVCKAGNKV